MEEFIDIFFEVLSNLSFSNCFRDIRKKAKSKFLRGVLYAAQGAGVLLLGAVIAAVLLLLFKFVELLIA